MSNLDGKQDRSRRSQPVAGDPARFGSPPGGGQGAARHPALRVRLLWWQGRARHHQRRHEGLRGFSTRDYRGAVVGVDLAGRRFTRSRHPRRERRGAEVPMRLDHDRRTGSEGRSTQVHRPGARPSTRPVRPRGGGASYPPGLGGREPAAGAAVGFRAAAPVHEHGDRLRDGPGRARGWVPAQVLDDNRAAVTGGRPALCAGLGAVDRCRGGGGRPRRSGGQTAAAQGALEAYRQRSEPRPQPQATRRRGTTSADGEVAAR
jgi:hypothetical protein